MTSEPLADGRAGIDIALVRRLVAAQFPQWSRLPIEPVPADGWDNRTYRLGTGMTVRLPTAEGYVPAVAKENRWLPELASHLPVPIPEILGEGAPGDGYPFPWSIRRWLDGEPAQYELIDELAEFATSVAGFIAALQDVPASGGPAAGAHSWHRGASLMHYDDETRRCLTELESRLDTEVALNAWEQALGAGWHGSPVWFHGDIASGNLLVKDGRLAAVIDFGTCGVGDPACDLVIAWTFFSGDSRTAFRDRVDQGDATWIRARGWALWKALLTLSRDITVNDAAAAANLRLVNDLLKDPVAEG